MCNRLAIPSDEVLTIICPKIGSINVRVIMSDRNLQNVFRPVFYVFSRFDNRIPVGTKGDGKPRLVFNHTEYCETWDQVSDVLYLLLRKSRMLSTHEWLHHEVAESEVEPS